jgi:hypothetical protein
MVEWDGEQPMSKTSNSQPLLQDGEMLAEYDLSQATRGRRHTHNIGIDLPGVQFLTNAQGQKTAVLLNLDRHQDLWQATSSQYTSNFQFLIDSQNHTRWSTTDRRSSVFLDFTQHLPLWEAIYDQIIATLPGYDSDYPAQTAADRADFAP